MTAEEQARLLKQWALEAGFDRAGVTSLAPAEHGKQYLEWLQRGDQATMAYLERRAEVRLDPRQVLEGARSALCVALHYYPLSGESEVSGNLWPGVARYARGADYHQLMERRLEQLVIRIERAFPSTGTRIYVDTGPVLERELAARAGLGAIGKNTNLLDPQGGSWVLLGEIFLTLELVDDVPVADLCGSCTSCLEACPTGALPQPYRLDSRKCISYWTIEHRGVIPAEVRPLLTGWVFGCDICQEVCPVNEGPLAVDHEELTIPPGRVGLELEDLLSMDRDEYVGRFRGSPMKRAKLEGLQRNAAVAMGNSGERRYVSTLIRALRNGSSLLRRHAAWALGQIGGGEAVAALRKSFRSQVEPAVREEIRTAIQGLGLTLPEDLPIL